MKLTKKEKKALKELKEGLKKLYGDNLSRVILYGSKARGDATEDSDIDVMVVLKKIGLRYDEISRITEILSPICLENDLLISAFPVEEKKLNDEHKTIFIHNVLKEGIEI